MLKYDNNCINYICPIVYCQHASQFKSLVKYEQKVSCNVSLFVYREGKPFINHGQIGKLFYGLFSSWSIFCYREEVD